VLVTIITQYNAISRKFTGVFRCRPSDATITFVDGRRIIVQGILSVEYVDIEAGLAGFAGSNPCFEGSVIQIAFKRH